MDLANIFPDGKYFSLLYWVQGVDLAPLYDLLCTAALASFSEIVRDRAERFLKD